MSTIRSVQKIFFTGSDALVEYEMTELTASLSEDSECLTDLHGKFHLLFSCQGNQIPMNSERKGAWGHMMQGEGQMGAMPSTAVGVDELTDKEKSPQKCWEKDLG